MVKKRNKENVGRKPNAQRATKVKGTKFQQDETEALARRWHQESWGWSCTVQSVGQGTQTHPRPIPPSYNFKCKFVSLKERGKE